LQKAFIEVTEKQSLLQDM